MATKTNRIYFNFYKSDFDKLTVKELREILKSLGVSNVHKLNKKDMMEVLTDEKEITSVSISSIDLTPKRIYELRTLAGENPNKMDIKENGDLVFYIGNDLKFENYGGLFLHKDCEILDELGYDKSDIWNIPDTEIQDMFKKIDKVVEEKWSNYCSGAIDSLILFEDENLVGTKEGEFSFKELIGTI